MVEYLPKKILIKFMKRLKKNKELISQEYSFDIYLLQFCAIKESDSVFA